MSITTASGFTRDASETASLPFAGAPGHGEAAVLLEKKRDRVEEGFVVLGDENAEHPLTPTRRVWRA